MLGVRFKYELVFGVFLKIVDKIFIKQNQLLLRSYIIVKDEELIYPPIRPSIFQATWYKV